MPSTSSSSSNTSYNPLSPFGAVEIPHSDTPPDLQSSQRTTPLSREPSVDSTSPSLPQGTASSDNSRPRATEKFRDMEDEQKGKEKGKDVSRNTSPSGSSQGELADNEMEAGPSTQPEEPTTPVPPPKKKRTRTLTTPHQAAVLHALLAQSRFPTTAMREEVGRQIGLSARKVQIWFQNQRQKARRPRGQNVPPLSRPPQYGAFQNIPSGSTALEAGPSSRAGPSIDLHAQSPPSSYRSAGSSGGSEAFNYREPFASEGRPQLSGPGVPGGLPSSPPSPRAIRSAPYPRPDVRAFSPRLQTSRPVTAEERIRVPRARALSPQPRQSIDSALAALTLPPLTFDRPRSYTVSGPSSSSGYGASYRPPVLPPPPLVPNLPPIEGQEQARPRPTSLQSESPFAFEAPLRIPPPFTLQPRPQWDDATFSPFHRPSNPRSPTAGRLPHEPFTLPPPALPHEREGPHITLPPPRLSTLSPLSGVPPEAVASSSIPPLSDPSGSMPARLRRYDEDDAQSHDQDAAL